MAEPKERVGPWPWPEGIKHGATARVRDRPESEGRIVDLDAPAYEGEPALVVIRTKDRNRWVVDVQAVQVKGIDYGFSLLTLGSHR